MEERRILDALGRGLVKEFPNPERLGCPGSEVLKRIASHEMPLSEAENWLDHLGSCSPCYVDFKRFLDAREWRRRKRLLAIAAGILLAVTVAGWALLHKSNDNLMADTAVLDLRDRSPARGTEPNPAESPLEISRRVSHLKIYLPVGSTDGDYDIQVVSASGELVAATSGTARPQDGIMELQVVAEMSSAHPGAYTLQIRKPNLDWNYPLVLR